MFEIGIGILFFTGIVVIYLLRKNNFGEFKLDAGKNGVKVEVKSSNNQTSQPPSLSTPIVHVGLNEEAIKKEFESLKKELRKTLESGKAKDQDEINILKGGTGKG